MEKLAIHGGVPVRTKRWVSKYMGGEELGAEEKKRVLQVLDKKNASFVIFRTVWRVPKRLYWSRSIKGFWVPIMLWR